MSTKKHRRMTISLPAPLADQLDMVSEAMGLSRSAFLSGFLAQSLPAMCSVVELVPSDASEGAARRYRGQVVAQIQTQIAALQEELSQLGGQDDLFKD